MKQHYSGTQNVTSIATFTARREAKFSPIRVGGYINQDVRFMKPGDSILIRLRTGGYTIGSIGLIEGEGDDAIITPDCDVPFEELDCVVGRIEITDCNACFDVGSKEAC